jgi:hypothetical protein
MQIAILPKTTIGKWAVILSILSLLFTILFVGRYFKDIFLAPSPMSIEYFPCIYFYLFLNPAGIFSTVALVTGFISIVKSKERSFLVAFFFLLILGILTLLFIQSARQLSNLKKAQEGPITTTLFR